MFGAMLAILAGASAAQAVQRVQLATDGNMCLAGSGASLSFVPCAFGSSFELGKAGRMLDVAGACLALSSAGSAMLAPQCALGRGERAATYSKQAAWFGWGRCLARDGSVAKGGCARLSSAPLWALTLHLDLTSSSPEVLISANPQLAAYLLCVLVILGFATLAMLCRAGAPALGPRPSNPLPAARLPVDVKCVATAESSQPARVVLTPSS